MDEIGKVMLTFIKEAEQILVFLSHWLVVTSFFEAHWWHFTDPSSLGISLPGVLIFLFAIFTPCLTLCVPRVRDSEAGYFQKGLMKLIPGLLLLLSSTPFFATSPWIRTGLLAAGVGLSPIFVLLCFCNRADDDRDLQLDACNNRKRSFEVNEEKPCVTPEAEAECGQIASSLPRQRPHSEHSEAIALIAVFVSLGTRWSFGTINIFYETWQAALVLFALSSIFVLVNCLVETANRRKSSEITKNRGLIASASTSTGFVTIFEVDGSPGRKSSREPMLGRESVSSKQSMNLKMLSFSEDDTVSSDSDSKSDFDRIAKSFEDRPKRYQFVVLFMEACLQGYTFGTLLVMFLWLFSTPNLLARWSDVDPGEYGIFVVFLFGCGIIMSMFHKKLMEFSITLLRPVKKNCNLKQVLYYNLLDLFFVIFLIASLIVACILQMEEYRSGFSFVGCCIFCLALPCSLSHNMLSIKRSVMLSRYSGVFYAFPAAIAFFAAVAFLASHVILVLFINPQISSMFLGRMDIILTFQILIVVISIGASSLINRMFTSFEQRTHRSSESGNRLFSSNSVVQDFFSYLKTPLILGLIATLLLSLSFVASLIFTPNHCLTQHASACRRVFDTYGNRTRLSNSTFSVLSWNVLLGHDKHGRDNLPCLGRVLDTINPDVVGLEESDALPPYWGSKDILSYLSQVFENTMKSYRGVHPLLSSLGVSFLTKHPVKHHRSYILPTGEAKTLPHYSLVRIDSEINNHLVTIFNVHAVYKNWTADADDLCPFGNLSRAQMNFIAEKTATIDPQRPLIIMGDFNLNPDEEQLDVFHEQGFQSALHRHRDLNPPSTLRNRFAIVDHIFYRGLTLRESKVVIETEDISDHSPVIAYFQLPT